ncbi:MAG TPA: N-acetyltransferase, partial [Firmicutes bacterium]|nr:N-acetyltransferase [Bacillota bacterium]
MKITSLNKENEKHVYQAAQLLVEGFKDNWPEAWPDLPSALEEVQECLSD